MNREETFAQFERAVKAARTDSSKKKEMGQMLRAAIESAGKTRRDIIGACIASRASVDRWLHGSHVPHPNQVDSLKKILLGVSGVIDTHSLASVLLDARYRPVIEFLMQEESSKRPLSEEQVSSLLELAEKSKGMLSSEMMRIFLGLE